MIFVKFTYSLVRLRSERIITQKRVVRLAPGFVRERHILSCSLCRSKFSCSSFHVIDSGRNYLEITIKEALHIKYSKPQLNRQLFNSGSSFVLNIFR